MSAVTDVKVWQWPPEVVAYAAKFNVADYLEPLWERSEEHVCPYRPKNVAMVG